MKVPLDYANPRGEQIELLVGRYHANFPEQRIGTLFLNPGGPGVPGVTDGYLAGVVAQGLSNRVLDRFDIVSWDPRGVAASMGVNCKAVPSANDIAKTYDQTGTSMQKDALKAAYRGYVDQCKTTAGKLLPFVSTSATVLDLEILRRAVGEPKLTYLGYSYGTSLGGHYLLRYPERVRAMVLDGMMDLWGGRPGDEDRGFDAALRAFLDWCPTATATDCPFARGMPLPAAFDALIASIRKAPLPTSTAGRTVPFGEFVFAVAAGLYSQTYWPAMAKGLEAARKGDGTAVLGASDYYFGTDPDSGDPGNAIWCADQGPVTEADVDADAVSMRELRLGLPYAKLSCVGWPVSGQTPNPTGVPPGLPRVVIVGSSGDPATPYKWAVAANANLPGSVLVTYEAYDHGAYGYGDPCIDPPIDAYLLTLTPPPAGVRCKASPIAAPAPMTATNALLEQRNVRPKTLAHRRRR